MACDVVRVRLRLRQVRVLEVLADAPDVLRVGVESVSRRLRCPQCGFKCHRVHDTARSRCVTWRCRGGARRWCGCGDGSAAMAATAASSRSIPSSTVVGGEAIGGDEPVVDALVAAGVCASRSDARRTITGGGIRVNGRRVGSPSEPVGLVDGRYALVQRGRRQLVVD